jgi:hypothetical protein
VKLLGEGSVILSRNRGSILPSTMLNKEKKKRHAQYEFYITLVLGLGLVKRAEDARLLGDFTLGTRALLSLSRELCCQETPG